MIDRKYVDKHTGDKYTETRVIKFPYFEIYAMNKLWELITQEKLVFWPFSKNQWNVRHMKTTRLQKYICSNCEMHYMQDTKWIQ